MDNLYQLATSMLLKYAKTLKYTGGIIGFLTLRYIALKSYYKYKKYPFCQLGFPIVGCIPYILTNPYGFLRNKGLRNHKISSFLLGNRFTVLINDAKIGRTLLKSKHLINRPNPKDHPWRENMYFAFLDDKDGWIERRKALSSSLFTITNNEFVLKSVTKSLKNGIFPKLNVIASSNNRNMWYIHDDQAYVALNTLFGSLFGVSLDINDPFSSKWSKHGGHFFESFYTTIFVEYSNLLRYLPDFIFYNILSHKNDEKKCDDMIMKWMCNSGYFDIKLDENNQSITRIKVADIKLSDSLPYIDYYINNNLIVQLNINEFIADIVAILVAGGDTTASSSEYGVLLLSKYGDIQETVYNELINVCGKNKEFSFKLLDKLHYFRAFIHETLRLSNVAPMGGVPHTVNKDLVVNVDGNDLILPKDCVILYNTYYTNKYKIHKNHYYDQPNLRNWLNKNNKFKMNTEYIFFGVGRRNCIGQSLALKHLYSMFALLIMNYKFDINDKNINIKQIFGVTATIYPEIGVYVRKRQ